MAQPTVPSRRNSVTTNTNSNKVVAIFDPSSIPFVYEAGKGGFMGN